jgi:hypothetical protein
MDQLLKTQKEARSNACLVASDILGKSEGEIRSEIRRNSLGFAQACAAARASSQKTGFWSVFQPYRYFIRVKSWPQRPNNFGQAHEKRTSFRFA